MTNVTNSEVNTNSVEFRRKYRPLLLPVFAVLLIATLLLCYRVLRWKDTTGDYLSSTEQLYNTPDNTIEAVFLGSSHCYCSIYPSYLWSEYGIAAFDMAISGQDKSSTYYSLREVLKTQHPKVVCVEMYGLLYEGYGVVGNEYRNLLSLKKSRDSYNLIREVNNEQTADYLTGWPIVHTRYRELAAYDFIEYSPSLFGRGAVYSWETGNAEFWPETAANEAVGELGETNTKWLERLFELSREQDFELIFFVAPFTVSAGQQSVINAAKVYASERGIGFVDFNALRDMLGIDTSNCFIDNTHTNALGAKLVSDYMGQVLLEYGVGGCRGEEGYSLWERDLEWYYSLEAAYAMERLESPTEYMEMLSRMTNATAVISLEAAFDEAETDYYEALSVLGIPYEEYITGGKWLFKGGKVTKILENDPGEKEFVIDLSPSDSLRVSFTEMLAESNIELNGEAVMSPFYHMSIVLYDDVTGKVSNTKVY